MATQRLLPRHQLVTLELLSRFFAKTSRRTVNTPVRRYSNFSPVNWPVLNCSRRPDLASVVLLNRGGRFEARPLPG
ncbi:MAG: hypothetical protein Ct9H300mP32_0020 [Verrucomicrobiota bacterium]|nr:MAG: hypothetical protein Ct9H300mP32_0020 [Verrucomicrobiota bacterium]